MSEYANRKDRGRLVGLVFSMQALGLIVGPLVALVLLSSGISSNITWRLLLGLGALPAAAVVYLRAKMPESPRFQARVQGKADRAAKQLHVFAGRRDRRVRHRLGWDQAHDPSPVPQQPTHAAAPRRDGRDLVPLRLRVLRQHPLAPEHSEGSCAACQPGGQVGMDPWHLRGLCVAGLPVGHCKDGPHRSPSLAVHRVRRDGVVLRGSGGVPRPHHHGCAVPGYFRTQLLLHRVRTEHDDLRHAIRGLSREHAHDGARHRRRGREARSICGCLP